MLKKSFIFNRFYFGSIKKFHLPDLGESSNIIYEIKEATIKKWLVKEGDLVKVY